MRIFPAKERGHCGQQLFPRADGVSFELLLFVEATTLLFPSTTANRSPGLSELPSPYDWPLENEEFSQTPFFFSPAPAPATKCVLTLALFSPARLQLQRTFPSLPAKVKAVQARRRRGGDFQPIQKLTPPFEKTYPPPVKKSLFGLLGAIAITFSPLFSAKSELPLHNKSPLFLQACLITFYPPPYPHKYFIIIPSFFQVWYGQPLLTFLSHDTASP